jgi:hypothetical protein
MAVRPAAVFPISRAAGEGDTADKGTSLEFTVCEARTLFRPHPQPLSHCVGEGRRAQCFWSAEAPASAWAEASLPHSIIPLSRLREKGTKGVRAIQRTCRFTLALGKIAPASKTSCRTVVPLPGGTQGVRTKERACLAATAHGKIAPTPEILYLTAVPLSGVGVRARCLSLYAKTLISRNQSSRVQ